MQLTYAQGSNNTSQYIYLKHLFGLLVYRISNQHIKLYINLHHHHQKQHQDHTPLLVMLLQGQKHK